MTTGKLFRSKYVRKLGNRILELDKTTRTVEIYCDCTGIDVDCDRCQKTPGTMHYKTIKTKNTIKFIKCHK